MNTRVALASDLALMSVLLKEVFTETYGAALDEQTLEAYVQSALSVEALKDDICLAKYLVAEHEKQILGVLKLVTTSPQKAEIEKLYVAKKARALGVGSSLLQAAVLCGKQQGVSCLWLKVWQENQSAIGFYERQGFFKSGHAEVYVGAVVFNDFVMEKTL